MSLRSLPLLALLALLTSGVVHAASPLVGDWTLDKKASTDPEDAFEDKLRRDSFPVPNTQSGGQRETQHDLTQLSYWDTVRKGKEANSIKNLRRLGTAYPLVKAERLTLVEEEGGMGITYDGDLPRSLRPNPNGKVFSAKGDELVHDTFGYTLSYWDRDSLVLESDAPEGGRIVERLTVRENPHQLEYVVRVQMALLLEPVQLTRIFNPAGAKR